MRDRIIDTGGWFQVDDGDFADVEFSVAENEAAVRGTINGVPVDDIEFSILYEIEDIDWDDPIESVRSYIKDMLVDMLAKLESASLIPGFEDVRIFLDSDQLSGYLPQDDLNTRMRERMHERRKRK